MNQETSNLPYQLTSTSCVSMEKTTAIKQTPITESSQEEKEIQQFEMEMQQIQHVFTLVKEIRSALEQALKKLPFPE